MNPAGEDEKNDAAIDELRDYILEPRTVLDQEQANAGDGEHMEDDEAAIQARLEDYYTKRSWLKTKLLPKLRMMIRRPCSQ